MTDIIETEPGLTGYQQELLDVIRSFYADNRRGPTPQEIANRLGSHSGVVDRLNSIERAGYITVESMMRPITLTDKGKLKPTPTIPSAPPNRLECMSAGIVVAQVVDGRLTSVTVDAITPLEAAVKAFESTECVFSMDRPVITVDSDASAHVVRVGRSIRAEYA